MIMQIMKFLQTLLVLAGLIGPLIALVQAVEGPGNGPAKKKAVLDLLLEAIRTAEATTPGLNLDEEMIVKFLSQAIDMVVGFLNVIGGFRQPASQNTD